MKAPSTSERGVSLVELMLGLLIASVVLTAAVAFSLPMIGRESMRNALYDLQSHVQLARMEAAARNHDCALLINVDSGRIVVRDTMGTATPGDDEVLYDTLLASTVAFEAPDANPPVTTAALGGGWWVTTFEPDGTIGLGEGRIAVRGGDRFGQVTVFAAGGSTVSTWSDSNWVNEG